MLLGTSTFVATAWLLGMLGLMLLMCAILGRTGHRFGIPVVFLFLGMGMLAGSEGFGRIAFSDYSMAFQFGTAALVLILLGGGLTTSLRQVRGAIFPAVVLATVGVGLTAAMVAWFGTFLGLERSEAILLGAVVSSTDAAAVFAVLRGAGTRLRPRVESTLEIESGINDPMAIILTVAATSIFAGESPALTALAVDLPMQLVVGLCAGLAIGLAARTAMRRLPLPTAGLYPVLTLGMGLFAFGATTLCHGSGFLAVYVAAVVLGNGVLPYRAGLERIHDALGWLSQVVMFLMLGLLVFPSQLGPVMREGFLIALFLSFFARPIAVTICLLPFGFKPMEIAFIGWAGLRGAVPIVLAIYPLLAEVPGALRVFNIIFFVVVMSAVAPGITLRPLARMMKMLSDSPPAPPAILEVNSTKLLSGELVSFFITDALAVCNARLSDIPFPNQAAATMIIRGGDLVAARGSTVLLPCDHVYVFCRYEDRPFMELLFGKPQQEG